MRGPERYAPRDLSIRFPSKWPAHQAFDRVLDRERPASTAATAVTIGMSTRTGRVEVTAAVSIPSTSGCVATRRGLRRPRCRGEFRDCDVEQVSIRSPRPERPISVSGAPRRAPRRGAGVRRSRAWSARRPRSAPSLRPATMPGGDGEHVLDRPADLDADHVGLGVGAEGLPCPSAWQSSSASAAVRPRRWSPPSAAAGDVEQRARAGKDGRRGLGGLVGHLSSAAWPLPRSSPLAAMTIGVVGGREAANHAEDCADATAPAPQRRECRRRRVGEPRAWR